MRQVTFEKIRTADSTISCLHQVYFSLNKGWVAVDDKNTDHPEEEVLKKFQRYADLGASKFGFVRKTGLNRWPCECNLADII